jgi:D-alanine transaminase
MSRIAYVNGRYVPLARAAVHIEDRGNQFSDAVYEAVAVLGGNILDFEPHAARFERSMRELSMDPPLGRQALKFVLKEVVRQNRLANGLLYMQISRGVARRDHAFPEGDIGSSLVVTAKRLDFEAMQARQLKGVSVISTPETRWARPDIKSTSLLANILAKQAAREKGAYEAIFVDGDGNITEGSSTNVWIVTQEGQLITRAVEGAILSGITRMAVLDLAKKAGLQAGERAFSLNEALGAEESFLTSTTSFVMPIISIDGHPVGKGKPGPLVQKLVQYYWDYVEAETGVRL